MPVVIRPYLPQDEDQVVQVWSLAARQAHPFVPDEGTGAREAELREVFLKEADHWVAILDGTIVGLLGMLGSEIGGLFVAPEAQGRGLGRALVDQARTVAADLFLEVYEKNQRARSFYEHVGFEHTGDRRVEETTGETLLTMALPGAVDGRRRNTANERV